MFRELKVELDEFLQEVGCDQYQFESNRTSQVIPRAEDLIRENKELVLGRQSSTSKHDDEAFVKDVRNLVDNSLKVYHPDIILEIQINLGKHCQFVSRCKDLHLPLIKGLQVLYTHDSGKKNDYDQTFMLLNKRQEQKFKIFKSGMINIMNRVTDEVYLDLFKLDNNALKMVLEA